MVLLFNMLDVGEIVSYVMWTIFYPESLPKTSAKRKILLLRLSRELVAQIISVRLQISRSVPNGVRSGLFSMDYTLQGPSTVAHQATSSANKVRCFLCTRSMNQKVKTICSTCKKHIFPLHSNKEVTTNCKECSPNTKTQELIIIIIKILLHTNTHFCYHT